MFDNQNDPYQMTNLAGTPKHADTLGRFRQMLKRRMAGLKDTLEKWTWCRDHWTVDRNILRGAKRGSHNLEALARILQKYFLT